MRMSQRHFDELAAHVAAFLNGKCLSEDDVTEFYHARGLSMERARWDTLHASKFDTRPLYAAGLNDAHVDTALRRILHHNLTD
jgi:hypothetical protein